MKEVGSMREGREVNKNEMNLKKKRQWKMKLWFNGQAICI